MNEINLLVVPVVKEMATHSRENQMAFQAELQKFNHKVKGLNRLIKRYGAFEEASDVKKLALYDIYFCWRGIVSAFNTAFKVELPENVQFDFELLERQIQEAFRSYNIVSFNETAIFKQWLEEIQRHENPKYNKKLFKLLHFERSEVRTLLGWHNLFTGKYKTPWKIAVEHQIIRLSSCPESNQEILCFELDRLLKLLQEAQIEQTLSSRQRRVIQQFTIALGLKIKKLDEALANQGLQEETLFPSAPWIKMFDAMPLNGLKRLIEKFTASRQQDLRQLFHVSEPSYLPWDAFLESHRLEIISIRNSMVVEVSPMMDKEERSYIIKLLDRNGTCSQVDNELRRNIHLSKYVLPNLYQREVDQIAKNCHTYSEVVIQPSIKGMVELCLSRLESPEQPYLDEGVLAALDLFSQMSVILLNLTDRRYFFPDTKPDNWGVTELGFLKLIGTKSIVRGNEAGEYEPKPPNSYESDKLLVSSDFAAPELEPCAERVVIDSVHVYQLAINIRYIFSEVFSVNLFEDISSLLLLRTYVVLESIWQMTEKMLEPDPKARPRLVDITMKLQQLCLQHLPSRTSASYDGTEHSTLPDNPAFSELDGFSSSDSERTSDGELSRFPLTECSELESPRTDASGSDSQGGGISSASSPHQTGRQHGLFNGLNRPPDASKLPPDVQRLLDHF